MADPVQQIIINEIVARLGNISIANGYDFDMKKISKFKGPVWLHSDMPQADVSSVESFSTENNYSLDSYTLPVTIQMWTNKTDKKIPLEVSMLMSANLIIAINRSTGSPLVSDARSRDLGGLVNKVGSADSVYLPSTEQLSWAGAAIAFDVEFSTPKGDPFTFTTI